MLNKSLYEELQEKIKVLRETVWYDRDLTWPEVEKWLSQFEESENQNEPLQCLFLLSNFMYFGRREIREMLKSVFRDLFKYPKIEAIRKAHGHTKDRNKINTEFDQILLNTRFLGVGNPSESGTHLLYFFRQENNIPKDNFINGHEIFTRDGMKVEKDAETPTQPNVPIFKLRDSSIEEYVFIDDLCGSGTQAVDYSKELVEVIKQLNPKIQVSYFALFATKHGLDNVRKKTAFDRVDCVYELDETFKAFSDNSRYYSNENAPIDKDAAKETCLKYDKQIADNKYVLGYKDSQLLLGFYHNTPDNTPPLFWYDGPYLVGDKHWKSIFQRYHKVY